jgi:hypothetical protein
MIRSIGGPDAAFGAEAFYSAAAGAAAQDFAVEQLSRDHWAELVLLFNSFEQKAGEGGKLEAVGISDGLEAEEKLCALMNLCCAEPAQQQAFVLRHVASERVCGCAVRPSAGAGAAAVYIVPGCDGASAALDAEMHRL